MSASNVLTPAASRAGVRCATICAVGLITAIALNACSRDSSKRARSDSAADSARRANVPTMSHEEAYRGATYYVGLHYTTLPGRLKNEGGAVLPHTANGLKGD
ncbi:MAG TPA: hypothetical protein VGM67_03390, partial [Gemmatimonadaceae bacterium]